MKELLDKLKLLDPTTYKQYNDTELAYDDWEDTICVDRLSEKVSCAWLQACLQEAISGKGWLLEQSTFTKKHSAKIWKPGDPIWMEYVRLGKSYTEALLDAYILACEART